MGPPAQWWAAPGTAPAAPRPSSSSPSSVCDVKVCPQIQRRPAPLLSHTVWGHVHIHNCRERKKERESVRDKRIEPGTEITELNGTSGYCGYQSEKRVYSVVFIRWERGRKGREQHVLFSSGYRSMLVAMQCSLLEAIFFWSSALRYGPTWPTWAHFARLSPLGPWCH